MRGEVRKEKTEGGGMAKEMRRNERKEGKCMRGEY